MSTLINRSGPELHSRASSLVGTGNGQKSANDSPEQNPNRNRRGASKRRYITRSRVGAISSRMDPIHWAILRDVGRLGVMNGNQLQRLHHDLSESGSRLARKKLAQLSSWQVLTRLGRPLSGWGYAYSVGPAGQRLLHPGQHRFRPPWRPQPSYLAHALAVSELYVRLREAEQDDSFVLAQFDAEPDCWRWYFGPGGARQILKPDAIVVVHLGAFEDRYFVEVDRGTEPGHRLTDKARAYIRYWQTGREDESHGIFPYVLFITDTEVRKSFIIEKLATLPANHWQLFIVTITDEAVERITTGTAGAISNQKEVNS